MLLSTSAYALGILPLGTSRAGVRSVQRCAGCNVRAPWVRSHLRVSRRVCIPPASLRLAYGRYTGVWTSGRAHVRCRVSLSGVARGRVA